MKLIIRLGTLLLIVAMMNQIVPSVSLEENEYVEKALNLWVKSTFLQYFTKFTLPPHSNITSGSELYNSKKDPSFRGIGKAGVINSFPVDQITKSMVPAWRAKNSISSEAADIIVNAISKENFKTIVENVYVKDDGQITYGTIGIVETSKYNNERRATAFFSYKKFKLQEPVVVTYTGTDACMLWGEFCPSLYEVSGFDDDESRSLFSYMRSEAIKTFLEENSHFIDFSHTEASQYRKSLPDAFEDALKKLDDSGKLPTELFTEDPFVNKFN